MGGLSEAGQSQRQARTHQDGPCETGYAGRAGPGSETREPGVRPRTDLYYCVSQLDRDAFQTSQLQW